MDGFEFFGDMGGSFAAYVAFQRSIDYQHRVKPMQNYEYRIDVRRLRLEMFGTYKIPSFVSTFQRLRIGKEYSFPGLWRFRDVPMLSGRRCYLWVMTRPNTPLRGNVTNGRKHRIVVICPKCCATIPAGRLAQHVDTKTCQRRISCPSQ